MLRISRPKLVLITGFSALVVLTPPLYGQDFTSLAYVAAHARYRTLRHARVPGYIVARSGFWNRITWIIPEPKVQTIHPIETLLQRRSGAATPVVDTAAGQVPVLNIPVGEALLLFPEIAERASSPGRQHLNPLGAMGVQTTP